MECKKANVLFLVLSGLTLSFCSNDARVSSIVSKPLPYYYAEVDTVFGNCDTSNCHQIALQYPVLSGDSLFDLQEIVLSDVLFWQPLGEVKKPSIYQLISEQEQIYKDLVASGFESLRTFYLSISMHVDYNNQGIFSYTVSKDAFTGGAHPNYEAKLISYSIENEIRRLSWEDIIRIDSLPLFKQLVKLSFFNFHALDMNTPANEQGFWFESGDFELNDSFSVQPEGIAIQYNNYEVASYATGPTALFIKWEEVKDWLTPRFKNFAE